MEEDVDFGKNKESGVDRERNDEEEDENDVPLVVVVVVVVMVVVEEPVKVDDRRVLAMGILELNEDGGGGGGGGIRGFVAKRFLTGEAGQDRDADVGDMSEDVDGDVEEEDNNKK